MLLGGVRHRDSGSTVFPSSAILEEKFRRAEMEVGRCYSEEFSIVTLDQRYSPVVRYWRKNFCWAEMEIKIKRSFGSKRKKKSRSCRVQEKQKNKIIIIIIIKE